MVKNKREMVHYCTKWGDFGGIKKKIGVKKHKHAIRGRELQKGFKCCDVLGVIPPNFTHEAKKAVSANAKTASRAYCKRSPDARFELATNGLTVHCSTAELIRNRSFDCTKVGI